MLCVQKQRRDHLKILGMALDDYLDLAWLAPPESWDRASQDSKREVECKHSVLRSPAVRINFASAQLKEKNATSIDFSTAIHEMMTMLLRIA